MTEAEWLGCDEPKRMLKFLRGKVSERKLRLFAVAAFRRLLWLLPDPRPGRALDTLEEFADGTAPAESRKQAARQARLAIGEPRPYRLYDPYYLALMLYREFVSRWPATHAVRAVASLSADDDSAEVCAQCALFRELFGNPFRPVAADPRWLTRNVVALARTIYDERAFERLPILADALLDAGCDNADVLAHCRGGGEHVRGCWVLDLLLGKE